MPQPIRVDGRNRRSDSDALEGGPVNVTAGANSGRVGTFVRAITYDGAGYPSTILVRERDMASPELFVCNYADVVPKTARCAC
jgi:hypothetical protein